MTPPSRLRTSSGCRAARRGTRLRGGRIARRHATKRALAWREARFKLRITRSVDFLAALAAKVSKKLRRGGGSAPVTLVTIGSGSK